MSGRVHILVLNHNGRALLEECLPSVVTCARSAANPCRVTVIDNASEDDSAEFVRRTWPDVAVLHMANRGLASFNDAMRQVNEPVVILLNNDVKLASGCVDRLAETFDRHPDCFLAGPLCWSFDGRYEGTLSELCFRRGLVHTRLREHSRPQTSEVAPRHRPCVGGLTAFALLTTSLESSSQVVQKPASHRGKPGGVACLRSTGSQVSGQLLTASAGAALAVSREKFLALGGFDPLFFPGRYEDLDLAFRGWLAGWKAYYVPEAVAYHKGSASFLPRLGRRGLDELDVRNSLLFVWKNLHRRRYLAVHLLFLAARLVYALATGQRTFLLGWSRALRMLPQVVQSRSKAAPRVRCERQLFAMLGSRPSIVLSQTTYA